ncbi:MAG: metallophosphatase family protein [Planctomycetota bacterium]|nr:MAG: metallophosphatase family protein [Planctomycetota bacterium]
MFAVISDIHSNAAAFEAVLRDIQEKGIEEILCLGDIIGYGPCPVECIDLAMENCKVNLSGNHEWAILHEAVGFNRVARMATEWHRKVLKPSWWSGAKKKRRWRFLQELGLKHEQNGMLFVHAAPQNPREEYILRSDVDEMLQDFSDKLKKAFELTPWVCFVGHTHTPGVIFEDAFHFYSPAELDFEVKLEPKRKAIINIGSVGQPRDGDPRSSYVTVDSERNLVRYHRVEYDVERTRDLIFQNKYLDDILGKRLVEGT